MTSSLSAAAFGRVLKTTTRALAKLKAKADQLKAGQQREAVILQGQLQATLPGLMAQLEGYRLSATPIDGLEESTLADSLDLVDDHLMELQLLLSSLAHSDDPVTIHPSILPSQILPQATSHVQLPQLQLESFDGSLAGWDSFYAKFLCLVDQNEQLSAVHKFHYLISALGVEGRRVIEHLPVSDINYPVAMQLLHTRFHNKRRVIAYHVNNLLTLPSVTGGSASSLRHFVDHLTSNYEGLKAMPNIDYKDAILTSVFLSKLSPDLIKRFERSGTEDGFPTVTQLIQFLSDQAKVEENSSLHYCVVSAQERPTSGVRDANPRRKPATSAKLAYCTSVPSTVRGSSRPTESVLTSPPRSICPMCKANNHRLMICPKMSKKTPRERFQWVKDNRRCINCLGDHLASECTSSYRCKICQATHHTLLHFGPKPRTSGHNSVSPIVTSPPETEVNQSVGPSALISQVSHSCLMATTLVRLEVSPAQYVVVRAVVDTAAAASFLSRRCVDSLSPPQTRSSVPVVGVGEASLNALGTTQVSVAQVSGQIISRHHPFLILRSITQPSPAYPISPSIRRALSKQVLADPTFDRPAVIDCILGADLAAQVITGAPRALGPEMPYILPTVFGAVLLGNAPILSSSSPTTVCNHVCLPSSPVSCMSVSVDLNNLLQDFWALEEPPPLKGGGPPVDTLVDSFFCRTTTRDATGRYTVRLPFRSSKSSLGDSYSGAQRRFLALERKLQVDSDLRGKYIEFMQDYLQQGHMVPATGQTLYFIPHHGVYKGSTPTSKLRVVFDAGARTSSGVSLNELLHKGPSLQSLISDILTLFREHRYVFSCDIRQMYRQINIDPQDFPYQCILWRDSPDAPLRTFYLTTVTYGVTSSPYLALRTLRQLLLDEGDAFPAAATVLRSRVFVDDIVGGADELQAAIRLRDEVIQLLTRGGFTLRKWVANHPDLYSGLPPDHCLLEGVQRILGLVWDVNSDAVLVTPPAAPTPVKVNEPVTKRQVLSIIASIYDPCGWVAPMTTTAKIFLQRLWLQPLDWDTPLPLDLAEDWSHFALQLGNATPFAVHRPLTTGPAAYEIHGFCDASSKAYAAVLYLRRSTLSSVSTVLLASKTRVAPIRTVTIPRLELCGALLLSTLVSHYLALLQNRFLPSTVVLWTDSTIVLAWLRSSPQTLTMFVANRVTQIQEATPTAIWRHVPSQDNPADMASRGVWPQQFASETLWWTGPAWLAQPESSWPSLTAPPACSDSQLERIVIKPAVCVSSLKEEPPAWSTWSRLYNFYYFCLCWRHRAKGQPVSYYTVIHSICYVMQRTSFDSELRVLKRDGAVTGRLARLSPFLDEKGIIRVGGRVRVINGSVSDYPILLPKVHPWVDLLIDHYHRIHAHAGTSFLQYTIAQRFWILSARQRIRHRVFQCVRCFRARPRMTQPKMGNLPVARTTPAPPFHHTGMDYCGPFPARVSHLRRASQVKLYLCIFICLSSKAVHLEVAQDLSTDMFLDVLERFISRRGAPLHLYSDCGTNFVGAARKLQQTVKRLLSEGPDAQKTRRFTQTRGIQFHFNPPAAPHQGGLWERMVRSAKHHLTRVIGGHIPTMAEFNSLIIRIEAILNSRPITPMSSDPSDLQALTPAHFLIGRPLTALPTQDVDLPLNPVKHTQKIAAFVQGFWQRWRREYLPTLQPRRKWTTTMPNLKIGDLVVLEEPHVPPLTWPLGRIEEVFTGDDGVVRSVQVRTATGSYRRPSVKVYRLPHFS